MVDLLDEADFDDHEQIVFLRDSSVGLTAIIAIHSTALGPAAGGTRFWHYSQTRAALVDALRLSRGMSYKNALAGLPAGGGKAVILADHQRGKTPEMLVSFAEKIQSLGGKYITAQDVGMSEADMLLLSLHTDHVAGLPKQGGNPGPYTSKGVYLGIKAAIKRIFHTDSASGVRIAIQGVGSVGSGVARRLAAEGADLVIADVDRSRAHNLAEEINCKVESPDQILNVEADVVSPNALGAILTEEVVDKLKAKIVAGGANNQLSTGQEGQLMYERGILYAPDYVINAGGIISVLRHIDGAGDEEVNKRVDLISNRLVSIWDESQIRGQAPDVIADHMAKKLIGDQKTL